MKKLIFTILALSSAAIIAEDYKVDLTAKSPWALIRNHGNRLVIKNGTLEKKAATIVTLADKQKNGVDTAFALQSKKFPVSGKKTITIEGELLLPVKVRIGGAGGGFQNAVHFFDAKGKALKPKGFTTFKVAPGSGKFVPFKATVSIPAGAVTAAVQLGADYPNVLKGQTFAVSKLVWTVK